MLQNSREEPVSLLSRSLLNLEDKIDSEKENTPTKKRRSHVPKLQLDGEDDQSSHGEEWRECSSVASSYYVTTEEATDKLSTLESLSSSYMSSKKKSKLIRRVLRYFAKQSQEFDRENSNRENSSQIRQLKKVEAFRQLAISRGGLVTDDYRRRIWGVLAENLHKDCSKKENFYKKEVSERKSMCENSESLVSESFEDAVEDYDDLSFSLMSPSSSSDVKTEIDRSNSEEKTETPVTESKIPYETIPSVDISELSEEDLRSHSEWNQVEMDVLRTLARFPPGINDQQRQVLISQLTPVIVRILWQNPSYRYYQGFHDVCLTLLLVLGVEETYRLGRILVRDGIFHELLTEPLDNCQTTLRLIFVIVWQTDPELEWFFRMAELGTMFSLSWLLTWFGHAIDSYDQIVRLYDLFLSTHKLMPVYFAAALILFRGADVKKECDCEMPSVHSFLQKIPEDLPLEALISDAQDLFVAYPPSKLSLDLSEDYERDVREQAVAAMEKRPYAYALTMRQKGGHNRAFAFTFWAVTASAAAWYLYSNSSTWMRFVG